MADESGERVIAKAYWLAGEALTGAVELRIEQVEHRGNPHSIVRVTLWNSEGVQLGGYIMALHPGRPPGSRDEDEMFVDRLARPTFVSGGGVEYADEYLLDDHAVPDGMLPVGR